MVQYTDRYGLTKHEPGEEFADDGYKFLNQDRDLIDSLLYRGATSHVHTGETTSGTTPSSPSLSLGTGGTIPAGTRVYYRISLVASDGLETAASTAAFIDTPAKVSTPTSPSLSTATTGGTLLPGSYIYALSAYVGSNTVETTVGPTAYITVPAGTSTNTVTLSLPSLPGGADGFNVYRQSPGGFGLVYLDSINMDLATPPTTYVDDGSVTDNCNRFPSNTNQTASDSKVTVTYPGATPVVPDGYTWKIYRTYTAGSWSQTLLNHVVEETTAGSGIIKTTYEDVGSSTTTGKPLESAQGSGQPSKIDLNDAAEVKNKLPMGHVSGFPQVVSFRFPGTVSVSTGTATWVAEAPTGKIIGVRAALGEGHDPASQDLIVNVRKGTDTATPTYSSIFSAAARPRIAVGRQIGNRAAPDLDDSISAGESLIVDVDQAGGGATPTDEDLVVNIYVVSFYTTSDSTVYDT